MKDRRMMRLFPVFALCIALFALGCSSGPIARDPGPSLVGPRGLDGPTGPVGEQGPTGATGAAGAVVAGPIGVVGPSGLVGAQGVAGQTGTQGSSVAGPVGPTGPAGLVGAQGVAGQTGTQGPTLVGPAGPAGYAGPTGPPGAQGSTMAGVAGPAGYAGPTGPPGSGGLRGAQGPAGVVDRWTSFRDIWFEFNRADIQSSETSKVSEIVAYMQQNPSLQVAIDGSMDPRGTDPRNQGLSDRRVYAIRDALVQSGVPAYKIQTGAFGDPELARDRRVEVLVKTGD